MRRKPGGRDQARFYGSEARPSRAFPSLRRAVRHRVAGHRRALENLLDGIEKPRLHVESATVVYCYPFVLEASVADVVRALERSQKWNVAVTPLTDAWDGDDPLGRRYEGYTVTLPEVEVTATCEPGRFEARAEIRLSGLGNLFVRVEYDSTEPTATFTPSTRRFAGSRGTWGGGHRLS